MHARCPWLVTPDDHEVENNYAGAISEHTEVDPAKFLLQRANAYQAYYEMMPLRRAIDPPRVAHPALSQRPRSGRLAPSLLVLDTRQYRTDQPNGDRRRPELNEAALDPKNTLLGSRRPTG